FFHTRFTFLVRWYIKGLRLRIAQKIDKETSCLIWRWYLMRCRASFLVMLMVVIAVLLAVSPASAADKSIAFGLPGPPTFGVEYEHGLSDSSSCCFTAGSFVIIFDFSVGLGMKWYKENSLMDGRYYGLSLYYGR